MNVVATCIRPEMPIYDALRLLANSNLTCAPVVDKDLKLVATLDEDDALKLIYQNEEEAGDHVSDFMNTNFTSVDPETNLIDLCEHIIAKNCRLIPIVEAGILAGVVNRSDLIRAILRIKRQELPN